MKHQRFAAATTAVAGLAFACILVFYRNPTITVVENDRIALAAYLATCILVIGATRLFFKGLKGFKAELKQPYLLLSIAILVIPAPAIIIIALILIGLIFGGATGVALKGSLYSLIVLSYILSPILMYFSLRSFAKLVSIRSFWTSLPKVALANLGVGILAGGIVKTVNPLATAYTVGIVIVATTSIMFAVMATRVGIRLRATLGTSYAPAMNWLVAAIGATAFAGMHEVIMGIIANVLRTQIGWYLDILMWPYTVVGLCFLRAGLLFCRNGEIDQQLDANATYLDAVIYAAQLTSNKSAIEASLDKLRIITASVGPDGQLTPQHKQALLVIYQEIETQLTTSDPLRKVTRQELRSHLTYDFQQALKVHEAT